MKAKWIVKSRYTTKKECNKFCKEHELNPENFKETEDFNGVEIFVVRKNNKDGIKLHGPGDLNKIILFDNGYYNKEEMKWCKQVAKAICDTLNEKEL